MWKSLKIGTYIRIFKRKGKSKKKMCHTSNEITFQLYFQLRISTLQHCYNNNKQKTKNIEEGIIKKQVKNYFCYNFTKKWTYNWKIFFIMYLLPNIKHTGKMRENLQGLLWLKLNAAEKVKTIFNFRKL